MSNCRNCGAPLPPDSMICSHCKTRHDIDLKGIHRYTVEVPETERFCPRCNKPMQTIDLKIGGKFLIERCRECLGMFFDPGELEALLDKSVANVYHINYARLEELRKTKRHQDYPVAYIKCPVCRKLMHRINFGSQSGVIVDKCQAHGIWLDGGELRQLLEWTKAGGQIHHEKKQLEWEKMQIQAEKDKLRLQSIGTYDSSARHGGFGSTARGDRTSSSPGREIDLFDTMTRFVRRLFR
jgi:Zn-finger nucleic acid-binding protein